MVVDGFLFRYGWEANYPTHSPVGNAVPGVPTAGGGDWVRFAGAPHLRNAGDGVPYGSGFDAAWVCEDKVTTKK